MIRQILAMTRKELNNYFGSPLAFIFLGTFLAIVLFVFFSVETFWVRNIADMRPLFQWMPILLIFLLATLTMRQWSEEQRAGTEELLLTLPVQPWALVLGKFFAVMALIVMALALTLPLTITVAMVGNLDWGPVVGGYLACLLMASAYAAIGLFVSSRTDSQIVALIATVLIGGIFYLVGTRAVTDLAPGGLSELLWSIGTGSRFESIQRGVIDLRDLLYYLSLTIFFLFFNTLSIDSIRWSQHQLKYRRSWGLTAALVAINLILLNVWLFPLHGARLDLTQNKEYSLSRATTDLFSNLQEPLLIRAYVSEKSHPYLQPLRPQLADMLREYEVVSSGRIKTEVVDPATDPELEAEANQSYGIRPMPFQVAGRYEASIINAYFDVLVRYGDQNVVLNFQDLIEVQPDGQEIRVSFKNLEYDLTRSIKKVVFGFQSIDSILASYEKPVKLTLYLTPNSLPSYLESYQATVEQVANEMVGKSDGKLQFGVVNLNDPNSGITPQQMEQQYRIRPIATSIFSNQSFYAHLVLDTGDPQKAQLIYPPSEVTEADTRTEIESSLKRGSTGFLKTVGIVAPESADPTTGQPSFITFDTIQQQLSQEYTVVPIKLTDGVPNNIDVLMILAPSNLTPQDIFGLDQYLMRGGAIWLAHNGYQLGYDQYSGNLSLTPAPNTELDNWLSSIGITVTNGIVMDDQNQPFPMPVQREVNGFQIQEIQSLPYPFFVDVRPNKMAANNPVVSGLAAVTLNYAAPVNIDTAKNQERTTTVLLNSSDQSYLNTTGDIQPKTVDAENGRFVFSTVAENRQSYPLAVSSQGVFQSYFAGKEPPATLDESGNPISNTVSVIDTSLGSARVVVVGSYAFLQDNILNLQLSLTQDTSANNLQFAQNGVDWSVEDSDLLTIRARGSATRVLEPLSDGERAFWEYGNYGLAVLALLVLFVAWRVRSRNEEPMTLIPAEKLGQEGGL